MNIQDSSTSSTSDISTTNNYDITIATTEESSSTLLHRLHTNERQLRTLAVILSLTGGLSLSFALGVGIMIYWYSRKCKQRRKLHGKNMKDLENDDNGDDDDEKSCATTNYSYCPSCDMMVRDQQPEVTSEIQNDSEMVYGNTPIQSSIITEIPPIPQITAATSLVSSSSSALPSSSSASSAHHIETIDFMNLPPPPTSHLPAPEPSAPSAKELHHLHSSSSRSNQEQQQQQQPVEEEELCHDCLVPPPAYTKEL